jgi:hypothetical protein
MNDQHIKRYSELYRIWASILKELKKSVKDHESRILKIEAQIIVIESLIKKT